MNLGGSLHPIAMSGHQHATNDTDPVILTFASLETLDAGLLISVLSIAICPFCPENVSEGACGLAFERILP